MYVVKAKNAADNGWTTIYDSSNESLCLISQPKHSSEMNQSGSFDFMIYPGSDFYDAVVPMDTFISAFEGTDEEHLDETFYGRVLTCEDDFYGVKNIGCEGALSFLKDATVGRVSTDDKDSGQEYRTNPQAFLQEQLAAYNAKVENRKKLLYGGVSGIVASNDELFKINDDQDFKSLLESQLIDVYGGFFKVIRLQNGNHELSYVKNYGIDVGTAQTIQIGQNILDKQKHATGEGVFTFIRPVGKDGVRLDDGVYHGIPCNSSNGRSGLYPVGTDAASFNALYARYGFIEKTKSFDDCETSGALADSCVKYVRDYGLDALNKLPMTFDVKLVDFFNANPDVKRIELGANYILTVDSEGRETGFEGHADGTPLQDGQEGLTLTVYSISREYENPENDSVTFYNATYLTAKDYSVILSSMTGSYGGGGSRGGLSGRMSYGEAEMEEERAEEGRKVEKRFFDDEESIGMVVTITENGKVINAGGIWTEITGTDKSLLQGTLDVDLVALRSGAVITAINNNEADGTSLTIDFDRLNITDGTLINVINGDDPSTPGALTINASKLKLGAAGNSYLSVGQDGSLNLTADDAVAAINAATAEINAGKIALNSTGTITLDAKLSIDANTNRLTVAGDLNVSDNLYVRDDLFVEGVINMVDDYGDTALTFFPTTVRFGGNVITRQVMAHEGFSVGLDATEGNDGTITISFADNTWGGHNAANFRIAATNKYINGVAAAYADAVNRVTWPTPPRSLSSFIIHAPTAPWNASTEMGTTENRIFELGGGVTFDSNHISVVDVTMKHNESGQAVTDGVVAEINVDASGVYADGWDDGNETVSLKGRQGSASYDDIPVYGVTIYSGDTYDVQASWEDSNGNVHNISRSITASQSNDVYIVNQGSWATGPWYCYPGDDYTFYPAIWDGQQQRYITSDRPLEIIVQNGGGSTINVQEARHASGTFAYAMNIKVKVNGTVYTVRSEPLSASDWANY